MLNFCLFMKALKPLSLRALKQQAKIQKNSRIFVNLRKFFRILPKIQRFKFWLFFKKVLICHSEPMSEESINSRHFAIKFVDTSLRSV